MSIGGSVALIVIGAILRFAVTYHAKYVNIQAIGVILMIGGRPASWRRSPSWSTGGVSEHLPRWSSGAGIRSRPGDPDSPVARQAGPPRADG